MADRTMGRSMLLWYDFEGDVMEIIFDKRLHRNENKAAYSLQMGFVLYLDAESMEPIQLTIVNYMRLTELPIITFDGWQEIKASDKEQLLPILNAPPVSNFLKLDPKTGYGHLSNPGVVEVFSAAA
ncbi:MAG: hypothetical protein ACE5I1_15400 [bacterium]